ncbi:MAG: bifunctional UDP-N-acetylglucosamine diphosphorylase/glucosamine-1-phosphate N-acetyltransferase GlmU [Porticoccaceae bacterium]|nr:bifunctional UDP-N-acetylglucosamine diphosphorylase/glucosamine-1-phosphate N-acetyltransferase GlmU [Porticoccaceae bacterium]
MQNTDIVILAAGKGTRMQSTLPKVLHKLAGQPLLNHVITAANTVANARTLVVTGFAANQVEKALGASASVFVNQPQQLGTAHAVLSALPHLRDNARVLVLYGDVPLISPRTIQKMLDTVCADQMGLLTIELQDPTGYGRILRDADNNIEAIIEQKDASPEQLQIDEINTGVMALTSWQLNDWLPQIDNKNAQSEYYLTDLIAIARDNAVKVKSIKPESSIEVEGVNSRQQLSQLERAHQQKMAEALMESGTSLADPQRFDQRGELIAGTDNFIDINCIFEGKVTLGSNVNIGPNCIISDSVLGDGVEVKANTVIEDAVIGDGVILGPFARIRPGTVLAENSKVGNFVEIKKSTLGKGSKINHLSYVGDAQLGENVNIGAGTITCNYDGANKYKTQIGDNSFIGSNSTLVAPVTVAEQGFVGAGSTVTKDVETDTLAVARAKQRNIKGWQRPSKKKD